MLIDTGAEISLTSCKLFTPFRGQSALIANDFDIYTADGADMNVLEKASIKLRLNDRTSEPNVVVVEHYSYDFLLGRHSLVQSKSCIDFVRNPLKFADIEIEFVASDEQKVFPIRFEYSGKSYCCY